MRCPITPRECSGGGGRGADRRAGEERSREGGWMGGGGERWRMRRMARVRVGIEQGGEVVSR